MKNFIKTIIIVGIIGGLAEGVLCALTAVAEIKSNDDGDND